MVDRRRRRAASRDRTLPDARSGAPGRRGARTRRSALVEAFERAGALDAAGAAALRADSERGGTLEDAPALNAAAERFLAATPSLILTLAAEDVLGEPEAVNVPGTLHEHPNWRRKRSLALEDPRMEAALQRAGRNAKR